MITLKFGPDNSGMGDEESREADEYLSKLAQSILSKDKKPSRPAAQPPPAPKRPPAAPQSAPPPVRAAPQPAGSPHRRSSGENRIPSSDFGHPRDGMAKTSLDAAALQLAQRFPWKREVEYFDESGSMIPGTILLFEDGNVGVYKETNPSKEYDIVYMLKPNSRAIPQGMPLFAYEKEPIGRLSVGVLDQLVSSGRWERDMLVFHLLKYVDRRHLPHITEALPPPPSPSENVSQMAIPKLSAADLGGDGPKPEEAKAFIRGRRFNIQFGPGQAWDAVYWGKDELGHVVAHDTHNTWTLMHLDLNRFKDSIEFKEVVGEDVLKKISNDISAS